MDFTDKKFVPSLKILLAGFRLPGEGQKVDRIMEMFGDKYTRDNPETVGSSECIYLLAYATMMLQTSIHNPSARNNYMTLTDFKKMTKGINNGQDLKDEFLEDIYQNIETDPITLVEDDEARIRNEGTVATSYKRKQEIFVKEGQGLAKRGYELMIEKKRKTTQFTLVNDSQAIGPLFESCWSAMFAVFSVLLEEQNDSKIIALCIDGFLNSVKICGYLGMKTERDAFVGSLAKFTGIYKVTENDNLLKRELTEKNIKWTQAILHLAMHEGRFLGESWVEVLRVMSMINYYHSISSGSRGLMDAFVQDDNIQSRIDPEIESAKLKNAAIIMDSIDESEIDKIFSNAATLDVLEISVLIRSMCTVSTEELKKSDGSVVFLLQKLVEVADQWMDKGKFIFSYIWKDMGVHFSSVGSHPNERVAEHAIDSLRQLAKKFLEQKEKTNHHLQKEFLDPFRLIMLNNLHHREGIKHFVLSWMCMFAQQKYQNIRSGWEIIIEIFKLAGEDDNINLSQESLQAMQFILKPENFEHVEEYFDKIVDWLFKFVENIFEKQSLIALDLIEVIANELGQKKDLADKIISKRSIKLNSTSEKEMFKKDLWKTIFLNLAKRSFEKREEIARKSHNLIFSLLSKYYNKFSSNLWEMIFRELFKAIFDDLNVKIESKDNTSDNISRHQANLDKIYSNLVNLISNMDEEKFILSSKILFDIITKFILENPNSLISHQLVWGMKSLIDSNGSKFDAELWRSFIDSIWILLDGTVRKQFDCLALISLDIEKDVETAVSSSIHFVSDQNEELKEDNKTQETISTSRSETKKHNSPTVFSNDFYNQSVNHLELVKNTEEIVKFYDILEYDYIVKLIERLKKSYYIAHIFNLNTEKRIDIFINTDWRAQNDAVPSLIKQERESLTIYIKFLTKLYDNPKNDITKQMVADMIIDFTSKVLKDCSDNYNSLFKQKSMRATQIKSETKQQIIEHDLKLDELNRILVSMSSIISDNVFNTLKYISDENFKQHAKSLAPLLIEWTISDQLEFRLSLRDLLKKTFAIQNSI